MVRDEDLQLLMDAGGAILMLVTLGYEVRVTKEGGVRCETEEGTTGLCTGQGVQTPVHVASQLVGVANAAYAMRAGAHAAIEKRLRAQQAEYAVGAWGLALDQGRVTAGEA